MVYLTPCKTCANFLSERSCTAYETIPDEIWNGKDNHSKNRSDDNGIKYKRAEIILPNKN